MHSDTGDGLCTPAGLPHSEILGSQPARGSPRLIAACHVLHRLSAPKHPPYTLSSLSALISSFCRAASDPPALGFLRANGLGSKCSRSPLRFWRSSQFFAIQFSKSITRADGKVLESSSSPLSGRGVLPLHYPSSRASQRKR